MPIYHVSWVQKIIEFAPIEAESEAEAIAIAKSSQFLDVDSEPHKSKPTNYKATLE